MKTRLITNQKIKATFDSYPDEIRKSLLSLRELILKVGNRSNCIGRVDESLKWGEPSYSTIDGSPIRLGWDEKRPDQFAIYFHCQTRLVSTFRKLYPDTFHFEGNRAITFHKADQIPEKELIHCIELAQSYHRVKKLPLLGT